MQVTIDLHWCCHHPLFTLSILQPIKIFVTNVFGLPIEASGVRVDIIPRGSENPVIGHLPMVKMQAYVLVNFPLNFRLYVAYNFRDPRIWGFGPEKLPDEAGFFTLAVKVESSDKRLVGKTGSSVLIKKCDDIIVDDLKLGVLEKEETVTGSSLSRSFLLHTNKRGFFFSVSQFSKHGKVLQADNTKRLYISFSVKPKTGMGSLMQPHQNLAKAHKDFEGLSGKYTAHLIIGDARIRTPMDWPFADFTLTIPPAVKTVEPKSHRVEYDPKPEIKHLFRQPEKRPPTVVSDAFTLICLAPLLLLLVLWFRIGFNFGNMPASAWTLLFHLGLAALFALYFVFWLQLNMFETLKYLAGIAAFTYLAGNRVLRAIAEKRK
ncbi:ribophorin II [Ancylostoma duodenale]|uniref:Dolichyl-diphosphooligosaccharide--protein glycosyltransferase subunit 2 n=1 Tax=Ancylostoma duodenale TaxID=51022 RepID=A0A0C2E1J9_9BILA|nr:ribophorin II [Ancylostoma duodenale]